MTGLRLGPLGGQRCRAGSRVFPVTHLSPPPLPKTLRSLQPRRVLSAGVKTLRGQVCSWSAVARACVRVRAHTRGRVCTRLYVCLRACVYVCTCVHVPHSASRPLAAPRSPRASRPVPVGPGRRQARGVDGPGGSCRAASVGLTGLRRLRRGGGRPRPVHAGDQGVGGAQPAHRQADRPVPGGGPVSRGRGGPARRVAFKVSSPRFLSLVPWATLLSWLLGTALASPAPLPAVCLRPSHVQVWPRPPLLGWLQWAASASLPRSVGTFARALDCSSSVRQPSLHMSAAAASRDITLVSGPRKDARGPQTPWRPAAPPSGQLAARHAFCLGSLCTSPGGWS